MTASRPQFVIRIGEALFGLEVAPKATGEVRLAWGPKGTDIEGARSLCDGLANTQTMAEAGSDAAKWALTLDIDGKTDWYIPSRDELELLYRQYKPTTEENWCGRHGENPSSVPVGLPYTDGTPAQTTMAGFAKGGANAFADTWYWSSTQYSRHDAWGQNFDNGDQYGDGKGYEAHVRAVRRFPLSA